MEVNQIDSNIIEIWKDNNISEKAKEEIKNRLYTNASDLESKYNASQNITILLSFILILIVNSSITGLSLGPAKVEDFSLIKFILPVLVSYKFYDLSLKLSMRRFLHEAINSIEIIEKRSYLFNKSLLYLIRPESSFNSRSFIDDNLRGMYSFIGSMKLVLIGVIISFGNIFLYIYIFWSLFQEHGFNTFFIWISLVMTLFFYINQIVVYLSIDKFTT